MEKPLLNSSTWATDEYSARMEGFLKTKDKQAFIREYDLSRLSTMLRRLDDKCFSRAVQYWKEQQIFAIHELFFNTNCFDAVQFLKYRMHLLGEYGRNTRQQTWLHCAVGKNVSVEFIQFIVDDLHVSPYCQDEMGNTAVYEYFVRVTEDNRNVKEIVSMLMGLNGQLLTLENCAKVTPLEVACRRKFLFEAVKKLVNIEHLLEHVNVHGDIFTDIEMLKIFHQDNAFFWRYVFTENDRSKLVAYMKDVESFEKKYLMDDRTFRHTFIMCSSDGALRNEITEKIDEILKKNVKLSAALGFPGIGNCDFYRSAPFLALITGRWNLVMPLVAFSRFDVVPFCLLTSAVCVKMRKWKNIDEIIHQKIDEVIKISDAYLIEITNSIYRKPTEPSNYDVVYDYMTGKSDFFNGSLLDAAFFAKSDKFICSPFCQNALSLLWKNDHPGNHVSRLQKLVRRCSSLHMKFMLHAVSHIVFLLCLFSVLLMDRRAHIGLIEMFCYLYGIGYFAEEVRQMHYYFRLKYFTHYYLSDSMNIIDLLALVCLLVAFLFRRLLPFALDSDGSTEHQNEKAFYVYLFLSVSSILLSVRLLCFPTIFKMFGSKLIMIERMITMDLIPVSVILFVFIFPFGVTFQSLIFTALHNSSMAADNNQNNTEAIIKTALFRIANILWQPTFTIFEPKYLIDEATENKSPSIQNPMMKISVQFLMILFIIIVSVMLMNMLIALFSQTVSEISVTAKESWKRMGWKFTREYTEKSYFPSPFNVIEIMFLIIKAVFRKSQLCQCKERRKRKSNGIEENSRIQVKRDVHPFSILFLKENRFRLLNIAEKETFRTGELSDSRLRMVEESMESLQTDIRNLKEIIMKFSETLTDMKLLQRSTQTSVECFMEPNVD